MKSLEEYLSRPEVCVLMRGVAEDKNAWLEQRRSTVGSSEIAKILGISRWGSALDVWLEKTGRVEPFSGNDNTDLGTYMEPYIGMHLFPRAVQGVVVERPGVLLAHPIHRSFTATPDFFFALGGEWRGPLECKNVGINMADDWEGESTPDEAHIQNQWQAGIAGSKECALMALVGGDAKNGKRPRMHMFDADLFDMCLSAAGEFLQHVKSDTPPPASSADLKKLHAERVIAQESSVDLPKEALQLLTSYTDLKTQKRVLDKEGKKLQHAIDNVRARLEQMQGNAAIGRIDGFEVRLRLQARAGYWCKETSYTVFKAFKDGEEI